MTEDEVRVCTTCMQAYRAGETACPYCGAEPGSFEAGDLCVTDDKNGDVSFIIDSQDQDFTQALTVLSYDSARQLGEWLIKTTEDLER